MFTKCAFRISAPCAGDATTGNHRSATEWRRYCWYGPYLPTGSPVEVRA